MMKPADPKNKLPTAENIKIPFLETYLNYLFESIKNIKEIIFNFFFTY